MKLDAKRLSILKQYLWGNIASILFGWIVAYILLHNMNIDGEIFNILCLFGVISFSCLLESAFALMFLRKWGKEQNNAEV